ncbi:MAG: hypothetical protein MUO76_23185 [Anaerolineaceae bacterium]|nr:hypothetical protein [Anaerolineaceae bacterium]
MNQKKIFAAIALISLIVGCCLAPVAYWLITGNNIFDKQKSAQDIGVDLMVALKSAGYEDAFALCDHSLQQDLVNPENLRLEIELYHLQPQTWKFDYAEVNDSRADFSGSVDFIGNQKGVFDLVLIKYKEGWRVAGFHLNPE